jgi:hypothetical protein
LEDFVMRNTFAKTMRALPWIRTVSFVAVGLAAYQGWTPIMAQPQPGRPSVEVQGTVRSMTTAPRGEVDGATLDTGTSLHWPPHMQDRFTNAFRVGDQVRAVGRSETGPAGDTHFEVESVTNLRTNTKVENPDYANGPPAPGRGPRGRGPGMVGPPAPPKGAPGPADRPLPPAPPAGNLSDVQGTVRSMTTTPRGEVDGAVLDNGTTLHWPPHQADRFVTAVKVGEQVRATGRTETSPAGDTHLEVQSVTIVATNTRVENPDLALAPAVSGQPLIPNTAIELERRLRDIETQIDQLRRDVDELRRARR